MKIRCAVCSDESLNLCHKLCIPNITRNAFEFWKVVSTFSVKAGTKKKTDNRADEITQVEENDDNYDSVRVN
jgi:hypothetical protein